MAPVLARLSDVSDNDGASITDTKRLFGAQSSRPGEYVDLGLAHGVPGVLALCSTAACFGDSQASDLAASAARYIEFTDPPSTRRVGALRPTGAIRGARSACRENTPTMADD